MCIRNVQASNHSSTLLISAQVEQDLVHLYYLIARQPENVLFKTVPCTRPGQFQISISTTPELGDINFSKV